MRPWSGLTGSRAARSARIGSSSIVKSRLARVFTQRQALPNLCLPSRARILPIGWHDVEREGRLARADTGGEHVSFAAVGSDEPVSPLADERATRRPARPVAKQPVEPPRIRAADEMPDRGGVRGHVRLGLVEGLRHVGISPCRGAAWRGWPCQAIFAVIATWRFAWWRMAASILSVTSPAWVDTP